MTSPGSTPHTNLWFSFSVLGCNDSSCPACGSVNVSLYRLTQNARKDKAQHDMSYCNLTQRHQNQLGLESIHSWAGQLELTCHLKPLLSPPKKNAKKESSSESCCKRTISRIANAPRYCFHQVHCFAFHPEHQAILSCSGCEVLILRSGLFPF